MAPPTLEDIVGLEMMTRGRVIVPANTVEYQVPAVQREHSASFHGNQPAMFVRCKDAGDVQEVLKFVQKHELPISVRSGGHSVCGSSMRDGTVVIDLEMMAEVDYDATTELVTIGPGASLQDVNIHLMRLGRMTPIGVVGTTGSGGLCLHGGTGWLFHRFGSSTDNITALTIVLADGTEKKLDFNSTGDDGELFFAARGCAGSLGVVTSFTMKTYPMEMVTGGIWMMADDEKYTATRKLMQQARDVFEQQEKEGKRTLFGGVYCINFPPEDFIPEELRMKPCTFCWIGSWGADDAAMNLAKSFADREIVFGKPPSVVPFNIFNQMLAGIFLAMPPMETYWKGAFMDQLPDQNIDAFVDLWTTHEPWANGSMVGFEFNGGSQQREHAKKLRGDCGHCFERFTEYNFASVMLLYFPPGSDEYRTKARTIARGLRATLEDVCVYTYLNFSSALGDGGATEEKKETESMFSDETVDRVSAIKAKVDPKNLFSRSVLPSFSGKQ